MPVKIPRKSKLASLRLVLGALLLREAISRFGKYKLGALWMLVQPLIGVIVIGLLLGPIVGRTAQDMPYAFFVLNGLVLLQCFRGTMQSGMSAVSSNLGLLVFPKVQPLDLVFARALFDLISNLLSFALFCIVGIWVGIEISLSNLHLLIACFVLTSLIASGIGMMLCVSVSSFPSTDKIVSFVARPLLFVSCVLYPLYGLPNAAQKILLWNPLVHTIELSRKSMFPFYHVSGVNLLYPFSFALIVYSFGICLFYNNRHKLTQK